MISQLQPSITSPKTTTDVTQLASTSAVASATFSEVSVSAEGPGTSEQQVASMRLRAQEEGSGMSEMERSWVEVQRKKKSSRVEGKVRRLLTCLLFASLIVFLSLLIGCFQSPPKPVEYTETEELNFEFDDDLELGGKKHNFSEQP